MMNNKQMDNETWYIIEFDIKTLPDLFFCAVNFHLCALDSFLREHRIGNVGGVHGIRVIIENAVTQTCIITRNRTVKPMTGGDPKIGVRDPDNGKCFISRGHSQSYPDDSW